MVATVSISHQMQLSKQSLTVYINILPIHFIITKIPSLFLFLRISLYRKFECYTYICIRRILQIEAQLLQNWKICFILGNDCSSTLCTEREQIRLKESVLTGLEFSLKLLFWFYFLQIVSQFCFNFLITVCF